MSYNKCSIEFGGKLPYSRKNIAAIYLNIVDKCTVHSTYDKCRADNTYM
jgi:hypothetical protein